MKVPLLLLVVLLLVLPLTACDTSTQGGPIPPPEGYLSWAQYKASQPQPAVTTTSSPVTTLSAEASVTEIAKWTGSSSKTTESFKVSEDPWTIIWTHTPDTYDGESVGILQVYVYDVNSPTVPIKLAVNSINKETDITYLYQTGTFYLDIIAANTVYAIGAVQ